MTSRSGHTLAFEKSWGSEFTGQSKAHFRIWAPDEGHVLLRLEGNDRTMDAAGDGWFEASVDSAQPGAAYSFVLADGSAVPDPASRAQQGDVHGPSLLVDPRSYRWTNADWRGRDWEDAVVYELHIGTFTEDGTFRAAQGKLPHLAETGITAVEIMPVAQFSGNRGWGYDGVLFYAPHNAYGTPDDLKAFIDAAHGHGLMVLLDVVYNHFGPDGNYLHRYARAFFREDAQTPWGSAIAYEREPVRRFIVENALYWLEEYNLDGLRLDAIDHVRDEASDPEILVEIARRARATIPDRQIHLTTEDNRNITRLHERSESGGVPLYTAEWNDDFHNVAHVIATGESDGYYADFAEDHWQKLARVLAEGFAYQGETSRHGGGKARGAPSAHLPPAVFVDFLQNHDQTGNRAFGERLLDLADGNMVRALTAILLLSPHIPLIFMGEEFAETRPFCFFTDFHGDLAESVRKGRRREFAGFGAFQGSGDELKRIPDPNAPDTFAASRLDWGKLVTAEGKQWHAFVRDLLNLRRRRIVPMLKEATGNSGRVIAADDGVIAVDWKLGTGTLCLRANLGERTAAVPAGDGQILYALGDPIDAAGALPPRCVVFSVNRGQERSS